MSCTPPFKLLVDIGVPFDQEVGWFLEAKECYVFPEFDQVTFKNPLPNPDPTQCNITILSINECGGGDLTVLSHNVDCFTIMLNHLGY